MAPTSGGDLVARMLRAEGVEVVFGIIDGSYFGLTSSLAKHGIRLVSPRHETVGTFGIRRKPRRGKWWKRQEKKAA